MRQGPPTNSTQRSSINDSTSYNADMIKKQSPDSPEEKRAESADQGRLDDGRVLALADEQHELPVSSDFPVVEERSSL
jgi:hypothetical protein